MTVYGQTSAQHYIENAKNVPLFASCPVREATFPNRERFGTMVTWVQAEHGIRGDDREFYWKERLQLYAIAKVIKE